MSKERYLKLGTLSEWGTDELLNAVFSQIMEENPEKRALWEDIVVDLKRGTKSYISLYVQDLNRQSVNRRVYFKRQDEQDVIDLQAIEDKFLELMEINRLVVDRYKEYEKDQEELDAYWKTFKDTMGPIRGKTSVFSNVDETFSVSLDNLSKEEFDTVINALSGVDLI